MCCPKATSPLTFAMRGQWGWPRMVLLAECGQWPLTKLAIRWTIDQSWSEVGEKSSNLASMVGVVWYCFHARNLSCVVTLRIVRHMDGHIGLRKWGKLDNYEWRQVGLRGRLNTWFNYNDLLICSLCGNRCIAAIHRVAVTVCDMASCARGKLV